MVEVLNSLVYEKYENVFADFVNRFIQIRKSGGYLNIFGKLMINSLYGSFALKPEDNFAYFTFSEEEFESILKNFEVDSFYRINNLFYLQIKKNYKSNKFFLKNKKKKDIRNISYSAAITSKARVKLYKAFQEVISDGGRILYCDTDSIFAGYSKENQEDKFFNKKWVCFYEDAVFVSTKVYALKKKGSEKVVIKGVNASRNNIKFVDLKEMFFNEKNDVFDRQSVFNGKSFFFKRDKFRKEIWFKDYDKRIFTNNKKSSIPLEISNTDI